MFILFYNFDLVKIYDFRKQSLLLTSFHIFKIDADGWLL